MRTNFALFAIVVLPLLCSCSSGPTYLSQWQSKPVTIDGDASDWQRPLAYYDPDSKLSYTITNDSTKLYLCVEAFDEPTQVKIIREGLQLWIDTAGGKDQEIGVLYPVAATMQTGAREYNPREYGSQTDYDPIGTMRRNFLRSQGEIELSGFKSPIGGLVSLHNAFGIEVRINWDTLNNILNYEAAIPFATFYQHSLSRTDSLKMFGIRFTVKGIEKQRATKEKGSDDGGTGVSIPGGGGGAYPPGGGVPGGAGGSGGMGRGGSGGGRRGGRGASGSSSSPLNESSSFWIRLRLASHAGN